MMIFKKYRYKKTAIISILYNREIVGGKINNNSLLGD